MDEFSIGNFDDDSVAVAAKQIIRRYKLQQGDAIGGDPGGIAHRAPDNPLDLRLGVEKLTEAVEQMQRLMTCRDAVFFAAIERVERNIALHSGRVESLRCDLEQALARPVIDIESVIDEQRISIHAIAREFSGMMQLSRSLLEDIDKVRLEALPARSSSEDDPRDQEKYG